jgi:hypothetical protein
MAAIGVDPLKIDAVAGRPRVALLVRLENLFVSSTVAD